MAQRSASQEGNRAALEEILADVGRGHLTQLRGLVRKPAAAPAPEAPPEGGSVLERLVALQGGQSTGA